jgi:hypothetical protein
MTQKASPNISLIFRPALAQVNQLTIHTKQEQIQAKDRVLTKRREY